MDQRTDILKRIECVWRCVIPTPRTRILYCKTILSTWCWLTNLSLIRSIGTDSSCHVIVPNANRTGSFSYTSCRTQASPNWPCSNIYEIKTVFFLEQDRQVKFTYKTIRTISNRSSCDRSASPNRRVEARPYRKLVSQSKA
jgi:hypothetical protein